jgi:Fibrobacter succinogenes major domain (Fib_succ_major)
MTTSRISAVAIALSIAFGFVGAGSTPRSAKDRNLSGTIASSKRMADGKEWTTANLNVNTSPSYCYDDAEPNCRRYGRLYTWESAQRGCQSLGDGWRLPTDNEWRQMANQYGGVGNDSLEKGKAAYAALVSGRHIRLQCRAGWHSLC